MYYNLTEDQKIFLETSYSMLKEGYTHDEIFEFWSSENEEQIEFVLESLEYVDIDRKDPELADLMENLVVRTGQAIWNAGPRAVRFIQTANRLRELRKLAQIAKPTVKQRDRIIALRSQLGPKAKDIKIKYRQTPRDEMAQTVKKTTGADDYFKTNRPGTEGSVTAQGGSARNWERSSQVVQQAPPAPAAPTAPAKPSVPFKQRVKDLGQNLGRTAQVTTAVGGGVALTTLLQPDGDNTPKTKEPSATQKQVDKDNEKYGNTVPLGSFNVSPKGTDRRNEVEDQIKRDNAARAQEPSPPKETTTDQPTTTTQQTNTTPPVVKPKRKRINFGSSSTPGVSRRGVTNSYEYVIGKLIAEGHASSIDEAEYVFEQLDNEYIESMLNE